MIFSPLLALTQLLRAELNPCILCKIVRQTTMSDLQGSRGRLWRNPRQCRHRSCVHMSISVRESTDKHCLWLFQPMYCFFLVSCCRKVYIKSFGSYVRYGSEHNTTAIPSPCQSTTIGNGCLAMITMKTLLFVLAVNSLPSLTSRS